MKVQKKSRSYNFLIEMLISSVFFAFAAIICVSLFFEGEKINRDAVDVSNGTIVARNVAEQLKSGSFELNEETTLYYDEAWNEGIEQVYALHLTIEQDTTKMIEYHIELIRVQDNLQLISFNTIMLKGVSQ